MAIFCGICFVNLSTELIPSIRMDFGLGLLVKILKLLGFIKLSIIAFCLALCLRVFREIIYRRGLFHLSLVYF